MTMTGTANTTTVLPDARALTPETVAAAIKATEYKYFGDYEMSDDQREAVDVLVEVARQFYTPPASDTQAEIERLRGLLVDPGSPPWENARSVLVAELRKSGFDGAAKQVAESEGCNIPSHVALNLIAHATKAKVASDTGAGLRERAIAAAGDIRIWVDADNDINVRDFLAQSRLSGDLLLERAVDAILAALATDATDNLVDSPLNTSGVVRSEAGFDDTQATDATDADDLTVLTNPTTQGICEP